MADPKQDIYDNLEAALDDEEFGFFNLGGADDLEFELAMDEVDEEEGFGGSYDWFGADDDLDDEFSEDDSDLDDLEAEIDAELFGQEPAGEFVSRTAVVSDIDEDVERLLEGGMLGQGMLLPQIARGGNIEWFMEWAIGIANPGEVKDIIRKLELDARTARWGSMGHAEKVSVVNDAIARAAIPFVGKEALAAQEHLEKSWRQSGNSLPSQVWSIVGATPGAFWELVTEDFPDLTLAWLEVAVPFDLTPDEMFNNTAMMYWIGNKVTGGAVTEEIVFMLDKAFAKRPPVAVGEQVFDMPALPGPSPDYAPFEPGPAIDVEPPMAGSRWPRPQTILGVGYGTMIVTGLLGIGTS